MLAVAPGYRSAMTSRADVVAVTDLAERLQLVYERDDEYPMRNLGEQLRAVLLRLGHEVGDPAVTGCSLLDPRACDSGDLRTRTRCLIEAARRWEAAQLGDGQVAADGEPTR